MNVAGQFARYAARIDNDPNAGTLSLLQVRDFLGRQWRLIAIMTGFAVILGVAYLAVSPKRYTAQADMIIDTKRVTWTQSEMASENRTVEDASVESEIETTKSERVAAQVERADLEVGAPEASHACEGLHASPSRGSRHSLRGLFRRRWPSARRNRM